MAIVPIDESPTYRDPRISMLESQLSQAHRDIQKLREELTAEQLARAKDADKRRAREAALVNELKMVQRGVKTGCVCPAGHCMNLTSDGEMCWAKWAGQSAIRDVAQRAIDESLRAAVHPRRMNEKRIFCDHNWVTEMDSGKRYCTKCRADFKL